MSFKEPNFIHVGLLFFAAVIIGRPIYRKLINNLDLKGDERVLDFGSGPGAASKYIAHDLLKGNGQLTCVDISKVWIGIIKKRLKKYSNVEFKLGDISETDIEVGSYDVILINFVLHDVEEGVRQRTVNALSSAMKETGKLFIKEPTRKSHGMPAEEIRELMTRGGLKEIYFKTEKSFTGPPGPKYSGVFGKV